MSQPHYQLSQSLQEQQKKLLIQKQLQQQQQQQQQPAVVQDTATQQKKIMQPRIILTNPNIIEYFELNPGMDCEKLFLHFIQNYKPTTSAQTHNEELKPILQEIESISLLKKSLVEKIDDIYKTTQKIKIADSQNILYRKLGKTEHLLHCDICKVFCVSTKKGLAAHQRKCGKKKDDSIAAASDDDGNDDDDVDSNTHDIYTRADTVKKM